MKYSKEILKMEKLFAKPLQADIVSTEDTDEATNDPKVSSYTV